MRISRNFLTETFKVFATGGAFLKDLFKAFSIVQKNIEHEDMNGIKPNADLKLERSLDRLESQFSGKRLWLSLYRVLMTEVLFLFLVGMAASLIALFLPLVLKYLFSHLDQQKGNFYALIEASLIVTSLLLSKLFFDTLRRWRESRLMLLVQQLVSRLLFRRLQRIDLDQLRKNSKEPLTYLTTYAPQLTQSIYLVDFVVTAILQIALILLMFSWFGPMSLFILGGVFLFTFILQWMIVIIGRIYGKYVAADHERVGILKLAIEELQSIKRQYLEPQFLIALSRVREKQVSILRVRAFWQVVNRTLEDRLVPFSSLLLVGTALWVNVGLGASDLFPLLILLGMLLDSISNNLANLRVLRNTVMPTREIESLFQSFPLVQKDSQSRTEGAEGKPGEVELTFRDAHKSYRLTPGTRLAIVGKMGVGKTSFLMQLAGHENEIADFPVSGKSFGIPVLVGRNQPLFDASLAEAVVLFQRPLRINRYEQSLFRSGLAEDLAHEPEGDAKVVHSKDKNLSEGQIDRLALAQALYAESDIILMDDLFASLNPELAHNVAKRVLGNREGEPTRIFTTSRIEFARYADLILVLDRKGAVLLAPQEIREGNHWEKCVEWLDDDLVEKLLQAVNSGAHQNEDKEDKEDKGEEFSFLVQKGRRYTFHQKDALPLADTYDFGERKKIRRTHLLTNVFALFPKWVVFFLLILITGAVLSNIGFATLIDHWKEGSVSPETFFLRLLFVSAIGLVAIFFRYLFTFYPPISSVDRLHRLFIEQILKGRSEAKKEMHQRIGRMTQDFTNLEMEQPNQLISIGSSFIQIFIYSVFFVVTYPFYVLFLIPFSLMIWGIYRQVKQVIVAASRLTASVRGPVFNFIGPALGAKGYLLSPPLRQAIWRRFSYLSDVQTYGSYWSRLSNTLVYLLVEGMAISFFLMTLWLSVFSGGGSFFTPSLIIYLAYQSSSYITLFMNRLLQTDTQLVLFERLSALLHRETLPVLKEAQMKDDPHPEDAYRHLLKEAEGDKGCDGVNGLWVDNLSYRVEGRLLFQNISFHLTPKRSMVLVGPSGIGKSTMAKIVAGQNPPHSGTVCLFGHVPEIDCVHTRKRLMSLESCFPSLPITIRQFLDPFNRSNDDDLYDIFANLGVSLDQFGGLEASCNHLSSGERQLLNLCRSVLQKPAILILDEATSSLDVALERKILNHLGKALPDAGFFAILHRPDNLDLFDEIIQIDTFMVKGGS
ncbi:MAG: diguanylate cyclase/phosphodiesterase (GGDEF & EAL domains) with PAS/PAC sensor(s) [Candidatus Carbobacillus altaicus]|uniref:Diguanylate cyclase/phosphodiesterase (GGDEF & EAL domains) with PAS/PAC sensor(S) n=1 Tax=Candidatus Carbonibacillus altaicus TaxID=2163959 RepID=A0A2R6XY35_9BACL|nr:MAG: diguanylate cyclase/phosphodiesterase (GGDEF & EAL domains) with PAS/PAC sensor(s) [Candidatus Carbobacillus altaicus]